MGRPVLARRRLLAAASLSPLFGGFSAARAQSAKWVLGQSLPLTGPGYPVANRIMAGARAQIDALNARGGVLGRPLEMITLDDRGEPQRTAEQVRLLARQHGALAIVNVMGEAASLAAAQAAQEQGVPLVGPLSGAMALRQPGLRHVYTLGPDDRRESHVLLGQLRAVGISRAVLLADGWEPAREQVLFDTLQAGGLSLGRVATAVDGHALEADLASALRESPQALVLQLGPACLDALSRLPPAALGRLPGLVASLCNPSLTQLTRLLRDRTLGFTSGVPIPELSQLPLVREFERDVETLGSPEAVSFEGIAAYLHVRLCAEAWRRAGPRAETMGLGRAIEALGELSLGGFALRFGADRHHGA
ncbi:ABC transporter substrate-binding protein, partial [Ideonella sp.]|uniref:ABC transporter substrate-binding protein n=1 Tax=Ideonella sp. TaxID=1929293 RepID=UPI003BB555CC